MEIGFFLIRFNLNETEKKNDQGIVIGLELILYVVVV